MQINSALSPSLSSLIESRLMRIAAAFLFLYSIILTLSPATRERSWDVEYRWSHWFGFVVWLITFTLLQRSARKRFSQADPYLIPVASLICGWGLLTIWRIIPEFGFRQTIWVVLGGGVLIAGIMFGKNLLLIRKYKYFWLTSGLILSAVTIVFGTNPMGGEPRLWLGAFGVYIQPSEPLKLLLIVFFSAYFADRVPFKQRLIALTLPTTLVTGIVVLLLAVQKDLGTATIFIFLYTCMVFIATNKRRFLLISTILLIIAGTVGYFLFDVVQLRIDAWLNPWLDPSGRSYQIVQALLAIANGDIIGRGVGMGSPGLVPVAISDFIFTSIAEETGLAGSLGFIALIAIFVFRGLQASFHAEDKFKRYLAAGCSLYFGAQSILIIGGNIRLLPLTGVTLPFASYGGSSLLTSFLSLFLLVYVSNREGEPAQLPETRPYLFLAAAVGLGFFATSLVNGWWAVIRGPDLLTRTDNARRAIADRYVMRGALLDRNGEPINHTEGDPGNLLRYYDYPNLAPVTGYTDPSYGQAGLEESLDPYLRGVEGYPPIKIWINRLLYGQPPPGLDIRLSLDLDLQKKADALLGHHKGAVVLMNAKTGEILVAASHPTYDPRTLDVNAGVLLSDADTPLLNRVTQGIYPTGSMLDLFFRIAYPGNSEHLVALEPLTALGFSNPPSIRLPVSVPYCAGNSTQISPLQMAIAVAALSNNGVAPAPRIAIAVDTGEQGSLVLLPLSEPRQALPSDEVNKFVQSTAIPGKPLWEYQSSVQKDNAIYTWYIGGTVPDWQGIPLAVVVLLEENNPYLVQSIGQALLRMAIK